MYVCIHNTYRHTHSLSLSHTHTHTHTHTTNTLSLAHTHAHNIFIDIYIHNTRMLIPLRGVCPSKLACGLPNWVYMYVCTFTSIDLHTRAYIHFYICTCTYVHIYIYTYVSQFERLVSIEMRAQLAKLGI